MKIFTIKDKKFLGLVCQKVEQPIGTLFLTSIPWNILEEISSTQPRMLIERDESGETYAGIQRNLSTERQDEIKAYLRKNTATFPSNIIINIPQEEVRIESIKAKMNVNYEENPLNKSPDLELLNFTSMQIEEEFEFVIISFKQDSAQIIDGQHRLSGFKGKDKDNFIFDLPVTIFINQDIYQQAEIFATINGKQTRVTPSLVYDLFGISEKRNPYTVARFIVKALNENQSSPLYESIKILGKANDYYNGFVTQSTVTKIIIELICGNYKQAEEDSTRMQSSEKISLEPELTKKKAPLRKYFIEEKEEVILKTLINFFNAVKTTFSIEWNKKDSVLKKTVGFTALLKILPKLIEMGKEQLDLSQSFFETKFEPSRNMDFSDIQLSSKGVNQLLQRFNLDVPLEN